MISTCGRKICVCRTKLFNLYMKYPKLPTKLWTDEIKKINARISRCSGSTMNNLEKYEKPY